MSNSVRTVSGSLSNGQRALILARFTPMFQSVYCVQLTWAYNVPQDFDFPHQMLDLTIMGHHIGEGTEALVARMSDPCDANWQGAGPLGFSRPDGKPLHITLSTGVGVPPARAGNIDLDNVRPVDPVTLRIRLHNRYASKIVPFSLDRLAA